MKEPFRDYGCFENKNNERIVCFNITKSYLQSWRPNLYECTRKYWRLDGRRAKKADLVFGRNRQTPWGGCTDANPKLLLNDT